MPAGPRLAGPFPAARTRAESRRALSPRRRWRPRCRADRALPAATRSIAASSPQAMARTRRRTAACTRSTISRRTRVDWVTPMSQRYRGVEVHEIPPNGQGIAALMALGILEHSTWRRSRPIRRREPAPADRGDEARLRRRPTLRRRPGARWSPARGAARPRLSRVARARSSTPRRAQAFRPRRAAARRHGLPVRRRRRRNDGVADPVELHGLRLGRRRARHRHQRCRTAAPASRSSRASERGRRRQAAVPHDHSRLLHPRTARRGRRSASWAARSSRPATCRRWCASTTTR